MSNRIVICIGRQFGSGGREIGCAVAEKLGIPFYDKEILKKAAKDSGIVEELFENADEKPTNDKLFLFQTDAIRKMADESSCVFIGRCADYILRERKDMFSVFIHAPLELRVQRICRLYNLEEDAARALIKKTDRSRANYHNFYADRDWGAAGSYDMSINSSKFTVDGAVELLISAVQVFRSKRK